MNKELIKRLLWYFFWLLIFEGVLRKWIFPQWANVLFFSRAPFLLASYFVAWRLGIFPRNAFISVIGVLAVFSFIIGLFIGNIWVTLFGLRVDFLYFPLIFLVPQVFNRQDVIRIGRRMLILSLPMALLMSAQFLSSKYHWLNVGVGWAFNGQIFSFDRVRAPGTFAYALGAGLFFSLTLSFLLWGYIVGGIYSRLLLGAGAVAFIIAIFSSASRMFVGTVFMEFVLIFLFLLSRRDVLLRLVKRGFLMPLIFLLILVLMGFSQYFCDLFYNGLSVLALRFGDLRMVQHGFLERFLSSFIKPYQMVARVPFWGYGIGRSTHAASFFLNGNKVFFLAEGEWERLIVEGGRLLGSLLIALRVTLFVYLFEQSIMHVKKLNYLPFFIFAGCWLNILMGQFGESDILAFSCFFGGVCLAAGSIRKE